MSQSQVPTAAERVPPRQSSHETFSIVGIGASAGGLDALERFFQQVSENSGMAFVIVQHLSPTFKSLMHELLARYTDLPIWQVEDGMAVEPNAIYLIPAGQNMILSNGQLLLNAQDASVAPQLPIDIFFRSLALDAGPRAVAVILSGTGSDGSRGIVDVSQEGGLIVVQSPESAGFDGMPRNALAQNVVDIVAAPEEMPQLIGQRLSEPIAAPVKVDDDIAETPAGDGEISVGDTNAELVAIFAHLRKRFQIDFSFYKPATILRRIERRMGATKRETLSAYLEFLSASAAEQETLFRDFLVEVTQFFRDPHAFQALEGAVLSILQDDSDDEPVRVWVAGCATGEEAYSLAILFDRCRQKLNKTVEVQIFATDAHQESLTFAAKGHYPAERIANLSSNDLDEYFDIHNEYFVVKPELRKMVIFAPHNLLQDPPFTRLHLISCRNVLIYLKGVSQERILSRFHFGLKAGGLLFLGASEHLPSAMDRDFKVLNAHWRVFRKDRDTSTLRASALPFSFTPLRPLLTDRRTDRNRQIIRSELYEHLLDDLLPASLLVDANYNLLRTFGEAGDYLTLSGEVSLNILEMVQGDLAVALRAGLHRASVDGTPVTYSNVRLEMPSNTAVLKTEDVVKAVQIRIQPLQTKNSSGICFLIALVPVDSETHLRMGAEPQHRGTNDEVADNFRPDVESLTQISHLETELLHTREYLHTAVEELETTNEELQSSNEELIASNEELQSTNEELQSVNEELYTVNLEHQQKILELEEMTVDIRNLQHSTQIAVLFLDGNLCIRTFTETAADLFGLQVQDEGRSISQIYLATGTTPEQVHELADTVLSEGKPWEQEVLVRKAPHVMRLLPYRGQSGRREGVVISFYDITHVKAAQQAQLESETRFRMLVDNLADALFVHDQSGQVVETNEEACRSLGYSKEQLQQMNMSEIDLRWREDEFMSELLQKVSHHSRYAYEGVHRCLNGETFPVETQVTTFQTDRQLHYVSICRNASDRQKAAREIERLNQELSTRALLLERTNQRLLRSHAELDRFVHIAAHDLREPLRGMSNYIHMLQHHFEQTEADSTQEVQHFMASIKRLAERMDALINDLRVYAGVGVNEGAPEKIDLKHLIAEVCNDLQIMISEGKVEVRISNELPQIDYYHAHARMIFQNLISNGIKYNDKAQKWIEIGTFNPADKKKADSKEAAGMPAVAEQLLLEATHGPHREPKGIYVRDNGIGIPRRHYTKVFDMFRRLHLSEDYGGGTGAGLTLVKKVIELHNGSIWLESDPNVGTTFYLLL